MMRGFNRFHRDASGTMAVETAIVAPVLVLLSLGGFEASQMIARHSELQSAAAEASAIVQASPPQTDSERAVVEDVIEASTGLSDDDVTLEVVYRCGIEDSFTYSKIVCLGNDAIDADNIDEGGYTSEEISTFVRIRLQDSYTPNWVNFGIGHPVHYDVERTVQVS